MSKTWLEMSADEPEGICGERREIYFRNDMVGFLNWATYWYCKTEGTNTWMESAKSYIRGTRPDMTEYTTDELLTKYIGINKNPIP